MASYYIALALRFGQLGITGDETRIGNYVILTLMLLVTFLNFTVHRNRGFMKRTGIQEFEVVLSYNIWLLVGIAVMVVALHVQPSPSRLMLRYFVLIDVAIMMIMRAIAKAARALQSKGAPFYSQERLGLGGKHFRLLKFRSMVADANDVEKYFTPEQLREWQTERKVDNDPRVTGIGRILCKTSLDEFPQFINVLRGDMSIVGPRPIVDEEIVHYGDRASGFLSCKPGITGWWQVEARNDADYASGRRQSLELYYVRPCIRDAGLEHLQAHLWRRPPRDGKVAAASFSDESVPLPVGQGGEPRLHANWAASPGSCDFRGPNYVQNRGCV